VGRHRWRPPRHGDVSLEQAGDRQSRGVGPGARPAEDEAQRRSREVKTEGTREPFECYLADAYAALLSGSGRGKTRRPELVVVVSHGVARRGWKDVRAAEVCRSRGRPDVARDRKGDRRGCVLTGVFYDGTDLRQLRRWSRSIPVEVTIAPELGKPPFFDGVACLDCGTTSNGIRPLATARGSRTRFVRQPSPPVLEVPSRQNRA
jgi:hypothetical protein